MTTTMKNFKYVSLFSGIGGFEQALNALGGTCVLSSEFKTDTDAAYAKIYGEHTSGDVTKIDEKSVPDHDVLVGGFPCQAFSTAGHRKGFEDARGTLFFEIIRIANEKKPKVMLLENVKGLLSHDKGNTIDVIVRTLNDIGYVVSVTLVDSQNYGTVQKRERLLLYCVRKDIAQEKNIHLLDDNHIITGKTLLPNTVKNLVALGYELFSHENPQYVESAPLLEFLEPASLDDYLTKEAVEERLPVFTTKEDVTFIPGEITDEINARILDKSTVIRPLIGARHRTSKQRGKRVKLPGSPLFTLTVLFPQALIFEVDGLIYVREISPRESLRLQRFPEDVIDSLTDGTFNKEQLYRFSGNAVTVSTIAHYFNSILETGVLN